MTHPARYLKMSEKKSVFLEVDSTAFENNLLLKNNGNESNNFESILNSFNGADDGPWKLVTPLPGFVIKTWNLNGDKVFINLCKADEIPEPNDLTEAELLNLWSSDEITDYRVPLSMMDPHDELDKSGKEAPVYDVAVNTNFFTKLNKNQLLCNFVVQVVQEGLENKYNLELKKEDFKILKNRTCIGVLKPHRIRSTKGKYQPPKRLIQEISSLESKERSELKKNKDDINYRLLSCNNLLLAQFFLPNIKSCRDIKLDVGQNRIMLEAVPKSVDIFIPYKVNEYKTNAIFNQNSKILNVFMPGL